MTYKDIILTLLNTRERLVCLEQHLLNDFCDYDAPAQKLNEWCIRNDIELEKVSDNPTKLELTKRVFCFRDN